MSLKVRECLFRPFYEFIARNLPRSGIPVIGRVFKFIRYIAIQPLVVKCGKNVNCEHGAYVIWRGGVSIDDNSSIGINSTVQGPIRIGKNVLMGPETLIYRYHGHGFSRTDIPMREQVDEEAKLLEICDDVWIGARSIILQNCCRIGTGAIIGAGSVVTKDVPDFAIVGGNPARVLRMRK